MEAPVNASPKVLSAYIEKACAGDLELTAEVETLFESARVSGTQFLERPPIARGDGDGGPASDGGLAGDEIEGYKLLQKIGEGGFGPATASEETKTNVGGVACWAATSPTFFVPSTLTARASANVLGAVAAAR